MGYSIVRKTDRVLNKGDDVVVCLPGAKIEAITERVENIVDSGKGGSVLAHINEEDKNKIKKCIHEVTKGECIIMGDSNHGHIQRKPLESTGGDDQQFLFLIQDSFLTKHVLEPTREDNVLYSVLS